MAKLEIMNKVSRAFGKAGLQLKKHSPEILVITGVVGGVVSAVMACKATTKAGKIVEEHKEEIEKIETALNNGVTEAGEEYTGDDYRNDLRINYVQTGLKYVKLYAPSVMLGAASVSAILAGHNITRKRNVALAAAYSAVDGAFKDYRGRVVERFGKELDKELRYNLKTKEVEEVVQNEDGSETIVKKTVTTSDNFGYSQYAVCFDETCAGWTRSADFNKMFLIDQERYANDKLKAKGYLFLNEVYRSLGIPETQAGQVVGWIYDEDCPNGDNYVDFGIFNIDRAKCREFINGYEKSIIIDPNVDGYILDKI